MTDFDPETGEQLEPDDAGTAAGADAEAEVEEEGQPQYENVYEFFEQVYSPYYELYDYQPGAMQQKKAAAIVWCTQWWEHRSVVARVVAAWYAWEEAYLEGGAAMSSWVLEHGNRHYDWIMAEEGPFRKCNTGHTTHIGEFPTEASPASLRIAEPNQEDNAS